LFTSVKLATKTFKIPRHRQRSARAFPHDHHPRDSRRRRPWPSLAFALTTALARGNIVATLLL
jgi:hypothetical protein